MGTGMGAIALAGYIATIGVATYLLKASLEDLSPYQINLLMGVAILAVSLPAVLLTEESCRLLGAISHWEPWSPSSWPRARCSTRSRSALP